jgi:hypothetical protein
MQRGAFGFTENRLFTMITDQKSVFQPQETHIPFWLDVLLMYINV